MSSNKKKVSFTLSEDCMKYLKAIAEHKGISMASVVELMTREEAKREKIKIE